MTEEMLMAGSKAKLAELVAKEIYNIRESRNLIIRGQGEHMPQDGESFRIILAGLDEQEQAFMQLFTGVLTKEVSTQTYQVIPDTVADKLILGRFSRKLGLLHGDDLAGSPLYIDMSKRGSTTVGDGSLDAWIYVPESNFQSDFYTQLSITYAPAKAFACYDE